MPFIEMWGDIIKEHHKVHVSVYGILTDFIQRRLVGGYIPRIYEKKIRVTLNLVDKKLRLAGCITAEGDSKKKSFSVSHLFCSS